MKLQEDTKIVLSEDTLTEPKKVRFSEDFEDVDITLLTECLVRSEVFPVGTAIIPLGNIATGKWLFVRPAANISISINGSIDLPIRANKVTRMWVTFVSLSVTVTANPAMVSLAIAGS